jgi:hypothetical protein
MRDDIDKLPLPKAAKAYARRSGLKSMMRQPKDFQKVNAMLLNPGKPDKFKEYECGRTTTGGRLSSQKHAIKEAEEIVNTLLDG